MIILHRLISVRLISSLLLAPAFAFSQNLYPLHLSEGPPTLSVFGQPALSEPTGQAIFGARAGRSYNLYRVPLDDSEPAREFSPAGIDVADFKMTPDRTAVVLRSRGRGNQLHFLDIVTGRTFPLKDPVQSFATINPNYHIAPDGNRVIFHTLYEVFSAELNGGRIRTLTDHFHGWPRVRNIQVSPDARWVVSLLSESSLPDRVDDLYVASADGGFRKRLTTVEDRILDYLITPNGQHVLIARPFNETTSSRLFRVGIRGGPIQDLNVIVPSRRPFTEVVKVSPDSSHIVYHSLDDSGIFSKALAGGAPKRLNPPDQQVVEPFPAFEFTSDSQEVLYRAVPPSRSLANLYAARLDGEDLRQIGGPISAGFDICPDFSLSPDGQAVVYCTRSSIAQFGGLFQAPLGGGAPVRLVGPFPRGGSFRQFKISGDSKRVTYLADQSGDGEYELYDVPLAGGNPLKLEGGMNLTSYFEARGDGSTVYTRNNELLLNRHQAVWISATGLWSEPANWRFGIVPESVPSVAIGAVSGHRAQLNEGLDVEIRELAVLNNSRLELLSTARLTVTGDVKVSSGSSLAVVWDGEAPQPPIRVHGEFILEGDAELSFPVGSQPREGVPYALWETPARGFDRERLIINVPSRSGHCWEFDGETQSVALSEVSVEPYRDFARRFGLSGPPNLDQDGDGLANIFEYLLGRNPTQRDPGTAIFSVSPVRGDDVFRFPRSDTVANDLNVMVQRLNEQGEWEAVTSREGDGVWNGQPRVGIAPSSGGRSHVSLRFPSRSSTALYRLLVRLTE